MNKRKGFVMVPNWFVPNLEGLQLRILLYAIKHYKTGGKNPDGKYHFHISRISNYFEMDEKTIRKGIKILIDLGLFELTGNIGHQYYLFCEERFNEFFYISEDIKLKQLLPEIEASYPDPNTPPLPDPNTPPVVDPNVGRQLKNSNNKEIINKEIINKEIEIKNKQNKESLINKESNKERSEVKCSTEKKEFQDYTSRHSLISFEEEQLLSYMNQLDSSEEVKVQPLFKLSRELDKIIIDPKIGSSPSPRRQDFIVDYLNVDGFNFERNGDMNSTLFGYKIAAFDPDKKVILVTATQSYLNSSNIQKLCTRFSMADYKVFVWIQETQGFHQMIKIKKSEPIDNQEDNDSDLD